MGQILDQLMASEYRGVSGVLEVDSGTLGPTAAILACTHGNEPAGLQAIAYLKDELKLQCGRVLFVVVNPEAARQNRRYIDHNMNRLPAHPDVWAGTVEGARYRELQPILKEFDGGVLDIHSTSAACPPMLVLVDERGLQAACEPHSPFSHVITDIAPHLNGHLVIEECPEAAVRMIAECGQHLCPDAGMRAVNISLSFLHHLGMISQPLWHVVPKTILQYAVQEAVHVPECASGYRLPKPITPFEWVEQGQPVACNGAVQVLSPRSGYAIMCPETQEVLDHREALLFLCEQRMLASA